MKHIPLKFPGTVRLLVVVVCLMVVLTQPASAGVLTERSVHLSDVKPSATARHTFGFTIESNDSVGSIVFEYCHNSPLFSVVCMPSSGADLEAAVLASQTGETGFTIHPGTTATRLVLTRTAAPTTPGEVAYAFNNVTNPPIPGTHYVRISTHASTNGSGGRIDEGAVAFSIQQGINTEAYVPPFLVFCSGVSVGLGCTSTSGFYVDLGELRPNQPSTGTSQYAGATNDESGYTVSVVGTTLTSGNEIIPALETPSPSISGTSQFGINLRANTNPVSGNDPIGAGTAVPAPDYGQPNQFSFETGDIMSVSNLATDYNRFTVTYLANVSATQPAGIYAATFTYVAVATF